MLEAGDYRDMLLQQGLQQNVADAELLSPAETKVENVTATSAAVQLMKNLAAEPEMKPSEAEIGASSSLMRLLVKYTVRLLKYAVPLPLLLLIVFGGLYLLCDGWHEMLSDLGLLISPQLKHVRGAPPI